MKIVEYWWSRPTLPLWIRILACPIYMLYVGYHCLRGTEIKVELGKDE